MNDDRINPYGCLLAIMLSLAMWCAIVLAAYMVVRR